MAESFSNSLISNTIFHLLNFERYPNFQTALREAAINNNFQIVLLSADFNRVFAVETRHLVAVEDVVHARISQYQGNEETNTLLMDYKDMNTYWRFIGLGSEKYHLILVDTDKNFSTDDLSKLSEIIELAMGMWNYMPQRDITSEFISSLRRGNRNLAHQLLDEMHIKEENLSGVYFIPGISRNEALKTLLDLEKSFNFSSLKQAESDEIAGVIIKKEDSDEALNWELLSENLEKAGAKYCFTFTNCKGIEDLCIAFKSINETESFLPLIFPYKNLFTQYEMALAENCIHICMNAGSVKSSYMQLLRPLSEVSDLKNKQLLETLETFILDARISSLKTAKFLGIHANTVQYRLKRIREIMNVDICDNTIIPQLVMALAIKRIDKGGHSI